MTTEQATHLKFQLKQKSIMSLTLSLPFIFIHLFSKYAKNYIILVLLLKYIDFDWELNCIYRTMTNCNLDEATTAFLLLNNACLQGET